MKKAIIVFSGLALVISCKTKTVATNLPKDISEKPVREVSDNMEQADRTSLEAQRAEILAIIEKVPCTDPTQWRISPLGSKACGGPASYIAYPIKIENEILPKIKDHNAQQSAFNRRYKIMSDCAMISPPKGVDCNNGKAILVYSDMDASKD